MPTDTAFDEDDFENLAETLGLPQHLPPLRLPPVEELVAAARESVVLARARELAVWVGERRQVTEDEDLTPADTAQAAALLGIEVDGEPDMPDVPELVLLWDVAVAVDLVVVADGVAESNADLWPTEVDDEDLATWAITFSGVLDSLALDADLAGEEDLDFEGGGSFVLLMFLARSAGTPVAELAEIVRETATEHLESADDIWAAWVAAHDEPAQVLLSRLVDHGAVTVDDEFAWLTPLGQWALREQLTDGGIDIPLLAETADMTAADLLAAVPGLTFAELTDETGQWVALRTRSEAAADLLAAAAEADPPGRTWAILVVTPFGEDASQAWQTALDQPALRAYARAALSIDRDATDLAWELVDAIAATADVLGTYDPADMETKLHQVVPTGEEEDVLAAAWRLPHPDTHDVLTMIGSHHPDKKLAKAARAAAHKAKSAT
jgi:hypothetical protein